MLLELIGNGSSDQSCAFGTKRGSFFFGAATGVAGCFVAAFAFGWDTAIGVAAVGVFAVNADIPVLAVSGAGACEFQFVFGDATGLAIVCAIICLHIVDVGICGE